MEIENTGVFAYPKGKAFFLRGSSCNVFAVAQSDGKFFLIDSGVSVLGKAKKLIQLLSRDGLELKNLKAILLTHAHPDHSNAVPLILKSAPQCEVWIHTQDGSLLEDPEELWDFGEALELKKEYFMFRGLGLIKMIAKFGIGKFKAVKANHLFEDGDKIGDGKGLLEVIHTPGHTPGHSCFYNIKKKFLFIGDLFDTSFENRPSINLPKVDFTETLRSHEKLRNIEAEFLASGHGDDKTIVIQGKQNVKQAIEQAIEHIKVSKEGVVNLLEEKKETRIKDYLDVVSPVWPMKFERLIVAWTILRELIADGKVKREGSVFSLI